MNNTSPALIIAAAGVGLGHAIMPDHWVPLAVVGRTNRYPLGRVARLSGLAGTAHVLVSIVLGAIIVAVGLQLRSTVEHAQDTIVGAVLLATGLGLIALELTGRGHSHSHDHGHSHTLGHGHSHSPGHGDLEGLEYSREHSHGPGRVRQLAAIMIPFGAAASPDLTILPVFLAAAAVGAATAVASLLTFSVVTIVTIISLTLLATFGGYRVRGHWLDRWGNVITAGALVIIGVLVITGAI